MQRDPKILWHLHEGDGPLLALAVHAGHEIRPELLSWLAIDEPTRFREEDPYTDYWTLAFDTQLLTRRSRFEVDLNRPVDQAVCVQPADCWNLHVWKEGVPMELLEQSLTEHAAFYTELERVCRRLEEQYGRFVVFDLHSYNHRRSGPAGPVSDPEANPDINIGTGSMERNRWAPVVDGIMSDMRDFDFLGRRLDVRENVNFRGRYLAQFVHTHFPSSGCALAVEVKKFFMDEWSGRADSLQVQTVLELFRSVVPGVLAELRRA
jgi:N-formylglutamate deformylase